MRPGRRLVEQLWIWLLLGLGASVWHPMLRVWLLAGAGLLLFVAWELWALRRLPELVVERSVGGVLPLGEWSDVSLRLENPGSRSLRVEVFDHYPTSADLEGLPHRLELPPRSGADIGYRIRPRERGDQHFEPAELLVHSPRGSWLRRLRAGAPQSVRVLPNFRAVTGYAILALSDRLGQLGIRLTKRRGEGLEFQELREYRKGDSIRHIDWKATSRRQQLISRQYETERNQQVVFLIDCGRRMRAREGSLCHFDHVLNAVLLLTWVAQRQGDAVGLMSFAGDERWLPPVKGPAAMTLMLNSVYDLDTSTQPPDYVEAASQLMSRQRRRALVILVSNLRDEDADELLPALHLLRRRNLVLLANLREAVLAATLRRPVVRFRDALRVSATHHYLHAREKAHRRLQGQGRVLSLDVEPSELPIRVVNRYLDIKRAGLL